MTSTRSEKSILPSRRQIVSNRSRVCSSNRCFSCLLAPSADMGVKMLQCFPFYRRCKERCKRQCPPETAVVIEELKPRLCSTTSWGSEGDSSSGISCPQAYFSHKARLSLRHQMDSNINAVDATY